MPKYSGAPERRKRHRHIVALAAALAVLLAGGAAWASTTFDSDTASRASDSDAAGAAPEDGSTWLDGDQVAKALRTTDQLKGPRWSQHQLERPTPTPTPNPTTKASPTEEPSPTETPSETPDPERTAEVSGTFPTMDTTGPEVPLSSLKPSDSITTDKNGQVIENLNIESRLKIVNDDVTVRNVRINHTATKSGQYALHIAEKSNGDCPEHVVLENIEIVGDTDVLADDAKAVYSECPFTLQDSRIYDVGTGIRIVNGSRIEGNFVHANFYVPGSGTHRSGLGLNGGADHVISGNTIECEGDGCSGALVMYGDFAQVRDVLIERNLFNTTGSYCTYAGSLDSKPNPAAENVRYIGNHFGRKFFPTCGRYGPVAGRDNGGGSDFVWEDNVWADTLEPVE